MNILKLSAALPLVLALAACSGNDGDPAKTGARDDHIWKEQARTLERARGVETLIMDSADDQREQIDQQTK